MFNASFFLQALINGILIGGVYSLVAVGLNLIFGVMKIINFAHGSLMMLGMYIAYWAAALWSVNPYVSLLLVIPLMFAIGAFFQKFLINPIISAPEHNQLLLTLGVSLFLENLALFLWSPDYRVLNTPLASVNYYLGDISISLVRVLAFAAAVVFTLILYVILTKDRPGQGHPGGQRGTGRRGAHGDKRKTYLLDIVWYRRRLRRSGRRHHHPVLSGLSPCGRSVRDNRFCGGGAGRDGQFLGGRLPEA